jgi:MFS family permease
MSYKTKAYRYYRSTLFQAILIGVLSFTQPGIWSAIAGLGAGGLQTVRTANTASSILFGIMFIFSPIFGILTNRIGIKPVITIGTIGFVFWSAGLYKNSLDGSQALILAGATLCGISASAFWTGEATVAILYPEEDSRGLFIGIWQCINKAGGVIAGGITLALNVNDRHEGKVGLNTYIVLMAIQCLGFPLSFLLSPPEKVIRKDGKTIKSNILKRPLKEELNTFWRVLRRKEIICLAPLALSVVWFNTWQSNYITNHFSVRVRALNSLLTALIPGLTDVVFGILLDVNHFKRSTRVKTSWITALIIMTGFFVYSLILQDYFDKHPQTGIDWTGYPDFAKAFIPFQVFRIGGEMLFNWLYWVIGAYQFTSDEVSHCSAIIRSLESLGQTFAFVIGTVNQNDMTNLAVAVGVFYLSAISTTYIVFTANENEITGRVEDSRLEDPTEEVEVVDSSFIQKDLES